jgi:hypothetical protein
MPVEWRLYKYMFLKLHRIRSARIRAPSSAVKKRDSPIFRARSNSPPDIDLSDNLDTEMGLDEDSGSENGGVPLFGVDSIHAWY